MTAALGQGPSTPQLAQSTSTPITQLSPSLDSASTKFVEGIVSLLWPFSRSSRTFILLLADPDFRLRKNKGQVKVAFLGSSAKALAKTHVGIGDRVRLCLDGASWTHLQEDVRTPGKNGDWDISFSNRVELEVYRDGTRYATVNIEGRSPSRSPERNGFVDGTGLTAITNDISSLRQYMPVGAYASPSFRKSKQFEHGSFLDISLRPLVEEDGFIWGQGRKRTKFTRQSGEWRYMERSPSPSRSPKGQADEEELQVDKDHDETTRVSFRQESNMGLETTNGLRQSRTEQEIARVGSENETSEDRPTNQVDQFKLPALPARQISRPTTPTHLTSSGLPEQIIGSITPQLKPLPSPGLPLVSPLVKVDGRSRSYFPIFPRTQSELDVSGEIDRESIAVEDMQLERHAFSPITTFADGRNPHNSLEKDHPTEPPEPAITQDYIEAKNPAGSRHDPAYLETDEGSESNLPSEVHVSPTLKSPTQVIHSDLKEDLHFNPVDQDYQIITESEAATEFFHDRASLQAIRPADEEMDMYGVSDDDSRLEDDSTLRETVISTAENSPPPSDGPAIHKDTTDVPRIDQPVIPPGWSTDYGSKLVVSATECVQEDFPMSAPPFPFHQNWDNAVRTESGRPRSSHRRRQFPASFDGTPAEMDFDEVTLDSDSEEDSGGSVGSYENIAPSRSNPNVGGDTTVADIGRLVPPMESSIVSLSESDSEDLVILSPQHFPLEETRESEHQYQTNSSRSSESVDTANDIEFGRDRMTSVIAGDQNRSIDSYKDDEDQLLAVNRFESFRSERSPHEVNELVSVDVLQNGSAPSVAAIDPKDRELEVTPVSVQSTGNELYPDRAVADVINATDKRMENLDQSPDQPVPSKEQFSDDDMQGLGAEAEYDSTRAYTSDKWAGRSAQFVEPELAYKAAYSDAPITRERKESSDESEAHISIPETRQTPTRTRVDQVFETVQDTASVQQQLITPTNTQDQKNQSPEDVAQRIDVEVLPTPQATQRSPEIPKLLTPNVVDGTHAAEFATEDRRSPRLADVGNRAFGRVEAVSQWFTLKQVPEEQINEVIPQIPPSELAEEDEQKPDDASHMIKHPKADPVEPLDSIEVHHSRSFSQEYGNWPKGLRTKLSYFPALSGLNSHFNQTVDVIGVCSSDSTNIKRATSGPKDYCTTIHITDPTIAGFNSGAGDTRKAPKAHSTAVQIFRPWRNALPITKQGDVVLLRCFKVQSRKHEMMLLSTEGSGWVVFATRSGDQHIPGPPVEFGDKERKYAEKIGNWWLDAHANLLNPEAYQSLRASKRHRHTLSNATVWSNDSVSSSVNPLIHELRDGITYTDEPGITPRASVTPHELRDGTVYVDMDPKEQSPISGTPN